MLKMQWLLILASILILLLILATLGLFLRSVVMRELKQKDELIQSLRQDNLDLLNRLMSTDLQAFATMTALTNSQNDLTSREEYYSQSDAAVLSRLQGLGTPLYDDQTEPDEDLNMLLEASGYVSQEKNGG